MILVLASVVSAGYYLPVIMQMYMQPLATEEAHQGSIALGATRWVLAAATALLLLFGFFPGRLMELSRSSSENLKPTVQFTLSEPSDPPVEP